MHYIIITTHVIKNWQNGLVTNVCMAFCFGEGQTKL